MGGRCVGHLQNFADFLKICKIYWLYLPQILAIIIGNNSVGSKALRIIIENSALADSRLSDLFLFCIEKKLLKTIPIKSFIDLFISKPRRLMLHWSMQLIYPKSLNPKFVLSLIA